MHDPLFLLFSYNTTRKNRLNQRILFTLMIIYLNLRRAYCYYVKNFPYFTYIRKMIVDRE